MAGDGILLVGMVGQGVFRTDDRGVNWKRLGNDDGMHQNAMVRALVADPRNPDIVFCGCDKGIYRSIDRGRTWRISDSSVTDKQIWCIAIDPVNPDTMFAGTGSPCVPEMFRSKDAGKSWAKRPMEAAETCAIGIPQMTAIAIDPTDHNNIWLGIEVDGLRHSTDGGETFQTVTSQVPNDHNYWIDDVHNLAITEGPPRTIFVLVGGGGGHEPDIWTSSDDGETWTAFNAYDNLPCVGDMNGRRNYPRGIAVKPGEPHTIFMSIGDDTPGQTGTVLRSTDTGHSWENLELPVSPNSAVWTVSVPEGDPRKVFAGTRYGYIYRSDDGGDNWTKLWRECSEIASIIWLPS